MIIDEWELVEQKEEQERRQKEKIKEIVEETLEEKIFLRNYNNNINTKNKEVEQKSIPFILGELEIINKILYAINSFIVGDYDKERYKKAIASITEERKFFYEKYIKNDNQALIPCVVNYIENYIRLLEG